MIIVIHHEIMIICPSRWSSDGQDQGHSIVLWASHAKTSHINSERVQLSKGRVWIQAYHSDDFGENRPGDMRHGRTRSGSDYRLKPQLSQRGDFIQGYLSENVLLSTP